MSSTKKTALITGTTAGIGKATAGLFAQHKWNLIITGRRKKRLLALQTTLEKKHGIKVLPLAFDVREQKVVEKHLKELPKEWQAIDVLVNNAGLASGKDLFQNADIQDWEVMLDTNVKGLLYVTRAIIPFMLQHKKGHIINVSSIAGKQVYQSGNVYCASKHAVDALCKAMRIDLLKHQIKVTSINPGLVETEFSIVRYHGDKEKAAKVYEGYQPLTAEDVADTIYYAATRPRHVNINEIILTPATQANSFYYIKDKDVVK